MMTDSLQDLRDQILGCPKCGAGEKFVDSKFERNFNTKNAIKGALFGGLAAGPFAPIGAIIGAAKGGKLGKGDIIHQCRRCKHEWRSLGNPDEDYNMKFR
jgi:hypothetical protein